MARVVLKSLEGGPKSVVIPAGKTVIGRGPLLGCGDKKVSRKHAILEVTESGDVYLTPIHVNPCFYHPNSEKTAKILKKDTAQKLEPGDTFSLLPRAFRYQVMMGDSQKNEEQENKVQNNKEANLNEENIEEEEEEEEKEIKMESEEQMDDDFAAEKVETEKAADSPEAENEEEEEEEEEEDDDDDDDEDDEDAIKEELDTLQLNGEKQCSESNAADDSNVIASDKEEEKPKQKIKQNNTSHNDTKVEKPLMRKRTLPEWLIRCAATPPVITTEQKVTKRRYATGTKPKKQTSKRQRYSDTDSESEERRPSKARSSRQNRQTRQGISLEDFIVSDDEEWASDESRNQRTRHRRGKKRDDDSGSDWEAEHRKKRRSYRVDSGSDSASDWETENKKKKLPKKSKRGRTRYMKEISDDDEEYDDDGDDHCVTKPKSRKQCLHGKDCYRKNPAHFNEFSHPGDSDYNSEQADESDDDDIPECPYGIDCYRKNPQHKKEYRHTKKVRPKREAAKKRVKTHEDDEEHESNLNDVNEEESDDYDPQESSDWEPGDSEGEHVSRLEKEAKGFVQNKIQKQV